MNHIFLSFGLVVYSIILFVILRRKINFFKSLAMILGCCGDMALAHFWIFENSLFVYGAMFFAVSHIFYIFAFLGEIKSKLLNKGFVFGVLLSILIILSLTGVYFYNPQTVFMLLLSIIYGLIIGFLCSVVFSFAYEKKNFSAILNSMGIIFFIFSDFLIGINIVGGIDFSNRGELIWVFYPIGQFLLIFDWKERKINEL